MFREVSAKVDYPELEERVIDFWRRTDAFRKVQEMRRGRPVYTFFEGPPTANGRPHIGHVLPRSLKDLFPRYKTMLGYYVPRKAGWDTHGLPVELEVEKALGLSSKPEIEEYGVEEFIKKCKESVWAYKEEWERLTERIGFWLDMENAYVTYHTSYIESVWWALKKIWDKGWLYQGYRVVPYCTRCGTSLSSHEVAQGYEEVEDPSVFVRLPLVAAPGEPGTGAGGSGAAARLSGLDERALGEDVPVSLLVWTTTPWTLPSNTAVAVHPDVDYVAVVPEGEGDEEVLVVAAALAPTVFPQGYRAVHTIKGRDLVGHRYRPPFPFLEEAMRRGEVEGEGAGLDKVFTVIPQDYVTLEEGTGLVHTAPAFGEDDMEAAREHGLPVFRPVDASGRFTGAVPPWQGRFVKDADPDITEALKGEGLLYRSGVYRHSYPFCYRCHAPLVYYADTAWFIKMTAVKDELIRINREEVNWYPDHLKEGRFGDWLENLVDWNLSRNRYWGTPLPIWECVGDVGSGDGEGAPAADDGCSRGGGDGAAGCGHRLCVGSVAELEELARPETLPDPLDLHKPYIDRVVITCPECGGEMRRVPEVIDCWFDSGAMPFAQWHYPFENREEFEDHFPGDFICEAIDQTRGWFYSLLAIAVAVFGRPAYRNVLVTEFGVDEEGRKMSKHIGNVVDPWDILNVQGADALRWFLYAVSHPWYQKRFSSRVISEFQGRMQDTLWNVYAFFVLYANLDGFEPDPAVVLAPPASGGGEGVRVVRLGGREVPCPPAAGRSVLDRWILSRLQRTVGEVRDSLDSYQVLPATRAIEGFVDDLSNWYVRRGRRRYWRAGSDEDKAAAYQTLYEVLVTLCRLLAPFTPFMTEEMYQNLVRFEAGEGRDGRRPHEAGASGSPPESVHHCLYPEPDQSLVDEDLERRMAAVRDYVALGRAGRNRAHIRTRQPLRRAVLVGPEGETRGMTELLDLLKDELNVKEVAAAADLGGFADYVLKPVYSVLGPRLGPLAPKVAEALAALGPEERAAAARRLAAGRSVEVKVEGRESPVVLGPDEVEVVTEELPGWAVEGEDGRYLVLDTRVSGDLLREGLAREMVNRIQRMRKDAGFEVTDHIETVYEA
ncbi:MAG TPA: isoleucine--tRNA ligase, partial [Clostridiales bacterium]|nr:isoleucine--tRNA ligase [Clostridiales bacterium]